MMWIFRNGCGFYSNAGNEGLCSVCYKDLVKKKQAPPTNMPASLAPTPGTQSTHTAQAELQGYSLPPPTPFDNKLVEGRLVISHQYTMIQSFNQGWN